MCHYTSMYVSYEIQNDYNQALKDRIKAASINPNNSGYFPLNDHKYDVNKLITFYSGLIESYPRKHEYLFERAKRYLERKEYELYDE